VIDSFNVSGTSCQTRRDPRSEGPAIVTQLVFEDAADRTLRQLIADSMYRGTASTELARSSTGTSRGQ